MEKDLNMLEYKYILEKRILKIKSMPESRDLPISLMGIETVLRYLDQKSKELSSIRSISTNTNLSMRVVKNILLQLEKFNQVERVVEKNKVLPKWKITKFGSKVLKQANGKDLEETQFLTKEKELIQNINIPTDLEAIQQKIENTHNNISKFLKSIQIDVSKTLGTILNLNDPVFEDLMGFIIKRIKALKQEFTNLSKDPIQKYKLKKMDEKQKKIKKKDAVKILGEILFVNSVILNEIKYLSGLTEKTSQYIESEAYSNAYSMARDIREELRVLTYLIHQRSNIKVHSQIFSDDEIKEIFKNEFDTSILNKVIKPSLDKSITKQDAIKEGVLEILNAVKKNQGTFKSHAYEIKDNIPLFTLFELLLDEKPGLRFTMEELERAIRDLADNGYIPGIKTIEQDEDHYFKVVQLKAHDISKDENQLIRVALTLQKFSIADIVEELGWKKEKVIRILRDLTELGILKHSSSFLHGDQWYIVSK
jgi:predicted transcriptional regulator